MVDRTVFFDFLKTHYGTFRIAATKCGLVEISFPSRHSTPRLRQKNLPHRAKKILKAGKQLLRNFFAGKRIQYDKISIDWRFFNAFDKRVLNKLRKSPPRSAISYGALARCAGFPRAARAVGNTLNRNPIPILIPCHHVVRKNNSLGKYQKGISWKKILLRLEKIQLKNAIL